MGDGKHFMVYPVRSGRLLNYVGFVPTQNETAESWSAIGDLGELAASFEGWTRASSGCSKRWRAVSGGVFAIASHWLPGPEDALPYLATRPIRCFRISPRVPTRRSKMA
ncbi:hypothetical protein GGD65_006897 [Bradyrhizobium sp. CIR18]|nr:hypothetical protein [Bradyrhizobium sp. CIR18]